MIIISMVSHGHGFTSCHNDGKQNVIKKRTLLVLALVLLVSSDSFSISTFLTGAKVEIACLKINCCFPSVSNNTVKLSKALMTPLNWKPFVKNTVTEI